MKPITPSFEKTSENPLYLQLYQYIKAAILQGDIGTTEKLPSLRRLSEELHISVTTVQQAYDQLLLEGYVTGKLGSGYYVSALSPVEQTLAGSDFSAEAQKHIGAFEGVSQDSLDQELLREHADALYDLSCFDFNKWKKCSAKVLTDYAHLLTFESDPQGEQSLRREIAKYLYSARGVSCYPNQIVIGAGTQQITMHLGRILQQLSIRHVAVEEPGYLPVKKIFADLGMVMTPVKVGEDGIEISRLPQNIRSAVYVSPSNQFPTGAVMPVGKRYELLEWAQRNDSIIIEDDYDSELRYFGRPIPAMQGLDTGERVVYLGSFSSTLFPAIKISYMVLTPSLAKAFEELKKGYTQTCSKSEQLTLALFMNNGYYNAGVRKLRRLYAQKLHATIAALSGYGGDFIKIRSAQSGLNVILEIGSAETSEGDAHTSGKSSVSQIKKFCEEAAALGITAVPVSAYADKSESSGNSLVLYFDQIPLARIDSLISELISRAKL